MLLCICASSVLMVHTQSYQQVPQHTNVYYCILSINYRTCKLVNGRVFTNKRPNKPGLFLSLSLLCSEEFFFISFPLSCELDKRAQKVMQKVYFTNNKGVNVNKPCTPLAKYYAFVMTKK